MQKEILSPLRRAVMEYNLIENGDKVAVGVSGGKDSLLLLVALAMYQKFQKVNFELIAISIDQTNGESDYSKIQEFCNKLNVELKVIPSDIFNIIFNKRKEKNPCSLCAKMRRGALNNAAKEAGCNKVALAHHKNDFVETFFLSMLHEGRLSTFFPKSYLSNIDLFVIRPFIHIDEYIIQKFAKKLELPILENPCPANKKTKREDVKQLLLNLEKQFPSCINLLHSALTHEERHNLPKKESHTDK